MKTLNFFSTFLLFFFLGATVCSAQTKVSDMSDKQVAELQKEIDEYQTALNLTDDQKPKFTEITKDFAVQMKAVADSDEGKLTKYHELQDLTEKKNKKMEKLLNKYQYTIYLQRQKENQEKMKESRKKN